jgi:hypothetical protein
MLLFFWHGTEKNIFFVYFIRMPSRLMGVINFKRNGNQRK